MTNRLGNVLLLAALTVANRGMAQDLPGTSETPAPESGFASDATDAAKSAGYIQSSGLIITVPKDRKAVRGFSRALAHGAPSPLTRRPT